MPGAQALGIAIALQVQIERYRERISGEPLRRDLEMTDLVLPSPGDDWWFAVDSARISEFVDEDEL